MEITVDTRQPAKIETEALVTYLFEQEKLAEGALSQLDAATGGELSKLAAAGELTGKLMETTLLHYPQGLAAQRLLIIGAGKKEKFIPADLRRLAGAAVRTLKSRQVKSLSFLVRENDRNEAAAQAVVEGMILANFDSDKYKTDKKPGHEIVAASLAGWDESSRAEADRGLARGRTVAESQNFARELGNEPSNRLTPRMLADRAEAMARAAGLAVEILDEKKIEQLKMGALLSVAQGSAEPPRMIVITYTPANPKPGAPVIGLVGKAVTFDTGGISIKPADGMEKMKYDMAGAAAVIGAMQAIAALKPPVAVTGIIPTVENMPGGNAQRPGDIVKSLSGKTIEILNTDAEGRLILADVLWYCQDRFKPKLMVDLATLTGAVIMALGHEHAGLFANNDELAERLAAAGAAVGEKLWRLPLADSYDRAIDSDAADVKNIAGDRAAGSIIGAQFIQRFVNKVPWAHLDIAGVAWSKKDAPTVPKGATAFGVRLLDRFVADYYEKA